jgi:hypothetical protein
MKLRLRVFVIINSLYYDITGFICKLQPHSDKNAAIYCAFIIILPNIISDCHYS